MHCTQEENHSHTEDLKKIKQLEEEYWNDDLQTCQCFTGYSEHLDRPKNSSECRYWFPLPTLQLDLSSQQNRVTAVLLQYIM